MIEYSHHTFVSFVVLNILWPSRKLMEPQSWHVNIKRKPGCRVQICDAVYYWATIRAAQLELLYLVLEAVDSGLFKLWASLTLVYSKQKRQNCFHKVELSTAIYGLQRQSGRSFCHGHLMRPFLRAQLLVKAGQKEETESFYELFLQ